LVIKRVAVYKLRTIKEEKMKTKHFFNAVMETLVSVIFSVLTGCGSVGPDVATANAVAEQLAADINAVKAESAEVNGATVRITDRVEIKTGLTVREGVTLDLTADGADLELLDGAVLTVNGTVNATGHGDRGKGWIEGSLRIGDGTTAINGSGTINLKSKGRLLNIGSGKNHRQLTLEDVTLVGLPDNDNPLVGIGENSEFTMKSGAVTGNTYASDEWAGGSGVYVGENSTFTMTGGTISGNTIEQEGGGVYVGEGSTFTMTGGSIGGNNAKRGGGVCVGEDSTFTMTGGTISGYNVEQEGGGVNIKGAFILSGGTISNNTAGQAGGGVCVGEDDSTFAMTGGTISGNHAAGTDTDWRGGGGVRIYSKTATFTKTGGIIYGNDADGNSNTAASGGGYAVGLSQNKPDVEKKRDATAGAGVNMDSSKDGSAGGWE
jgi:hypothetical protein